MHGYAVMLVLYLYICVCVCRKVFFVCCYEQKARLVSESVLEQGSLHNIPMISSAERISLKAVL